MQLLTISQLKQKTSETACSAEIDVQLQKCVTKTTKSGKPYLEATFTDTTDQFTLKIWENLPQFQSIQDLEVEAFLRLRGDWVQNQYGIEGVRWELRLLNQGEIDSFLTGDPITREVQDKDWQDILNLTSSIADPRLHAICTLFIQKHGEAFRRTAAARKNHHARRGGIVEHVAQMMRCANAICTVYTDLNRDLLIAGVLFHDCGKLWENTYPETGFTQPFDLEGEMLGHIPLGIKLAENLWDELLATSPQASDWENLSPSNSEVKIHLLHLIASHHGTYEFGSPTLPRTPEAFALHHIDNLDAKHEMFKQAYLTAPEIAPNIQERQFPLPANLVKPLDHFPSELGKAQQFIAEKTDNSTEQANKLNDEPMLEDDELDEEVPKQPFDGELF